jgi:hypothetical protein
VSCSQRYASSEEPTRPWSYRPAWYRHRPRKRNRPGAPGGRSAGQKAPWTSEDTAAAADRRAASLETRARTNMP